MKAIKIITITILFAQAFFFKNVCFCVSEAPPKQIIFLTAIPKCGTHLALKCINLLTKKKSKWVKNNPLPNPDFPVGNDIEILQKEIDELSEKQYLCGHIACGDKFEKLAEKRKCKVFFMYRDPRGQLASLTRWRLNPESKWRLEDGFKIENDYKKIVFSLIQEGALYKTWWPCVNCINDVYALFLPWALNPNFFAIRFEDLVGSHGGGSREKQQDTVLQMAKYLDLNLSSQEISNICDHLYGGTVTFKQGNKGLIDGWRKEFDADTIKLIKEKMGQLLIDLGYEKDLNW